MLFKSDKSQGKTSFNLLRCCDEKNHAQLMSYEDAQLLLSQKKPVNNIVSYNHQGRTPQISQKRSVKQRMIAKGKPQDFTHDISFKKHKIPRNSESETNQYSQTALTYQFGLNKQKKTSLKHRKRISENQPFLDLSNHHPKKVEKRPSFFTLDFTQNNWNRISLRLGQNLPTVRSEYKSHYSESQL